MAVAQTPDDRPIGDVNTTPLIDVMLVLLVMFIITIPIQSHSVPVDLPGEHSVVVNDERNKLVLTESGSLLWNNARLSFEELRVTLARIGSMSRQPELLFEPDAQARYAIVDEVLAAMKRANVTSLGFVGNERYARF